MKAFFTVSLYFAATVFLFAQGVVIDGYTYEVGNRGYLSQVEIKVTDDASGQLLLTTTSDVDGHFVLDLPPVSSVTIEASKEIFKPVSKKVVFSNPKEFVKIEMERAPGYLFEITLADKKDSINQSVDALVGTLIEVYNNTTKKEVLKLENHQNPEFKVNLQKGNHYTILVRKKGYLAKQMEAFVNVRGCILCFEGISDVGPGVSDNLTAGNQYGTLVANVEMDKLFSGKSFDVENLYYDLNSAKLKEDSKKELDKVINVLKYNPNLTLELGSHTDSRGKDEYNQKLSEARAESAVEYILKEGDIPTHRIYSVGYGERYLRNECGDGVDCSEEEHAKNRRTEVKVVGIGDEWIFKPLVNIKAQEQFEAELKKELGEALEKEKLNKEKYKDIEGEKYYKEEVQEVTEEVEEVESEKEAITAKTKKIIEVESKEIEKEEVAEVEEEVVTQKMTQGSKDVVAEVEEKMVKDSIWITDATPVEKSNERNSNDSRFEGEMNKRGQKLESKARESEEKSNRVRDNIINRKEDASQDIEEIEGMKSKDNVTTKVSDGFKIVIHLGDHPLSADHKVYQKHSDLEVYKSKSGYYYYMLPGFETKGAAQTAIDSKYLALYPNAYVTRFYKGQKI